MSVEGSYDVLAVVDQTHLPHAIKDRVTGATLGWSHEVKMKSRTGSGKEQDFRVAAVFTYDIFNDEQLLIGLAPLHTMMVSAFTVAVFPPAATAAIATPFVDTKSGIPDRHKHTPM